jgi:hypothetical protein
MNTEWARVIISMERTSRERKGLGIKLTDFMEKWGHY